MVGTFYAMEKKMSEIQENADFNADGCQWVNGLPGDPNFGDKYVTTQIEFHGNRHLRVLEYIREIYYSNSHIREYRILRNDEFNESVLKERFEYIPMAKRDRSNDRDVSDLVMDVYNATQSASARDWPSAAYHAFEVSRDVIDITVNTAESFIESRTDAVRGGYAGYSDLGL
jgi:hypothetical protein